MCTTPVVLRAGVWLHGRQEARLNAVYEDKPLLPRPYTSPYANETTAEVGRMATILFQRPRDDRDPWWSEQVTVLTVKPKRELLGLAVSRPRSSFRKPYVFSDRDTSESQHKARERSLLRAPEIRIG
jgi:hypothetical protein